MRLLVKENGGRCFFLPLQTIVANAPHAPNANAASVGESKSYTFTLDTQGETFQHAFLYLNDDEDENLLGEIDAGEETFWIRDERNVKTKVKKKPFIGQIDFVRLVLRVITLSEQEVVVYSPLLLCVTKDERDAENIHAMLDALLNFDDDFVTHALFEHRSVKSPSAMACGSLAQCSYKPFRVYLALLEKIVAAYTKNATYFRRKAHFRVSRQDKLMDILEVREVRADDVQWLALHADGLSEVSGEKGIKVDGKYYLPSHLQSADKYNSRDVYENRVVCSFLITVQKVAARFYRLLDEAVSQGKSALANYTSFTVSGKAPIITIKKYLVDSQRTNLQRLENIIKDLQHLLLSYRSFLPCPDGVLKEMPRATKIFLNNQSYREIFNLMHDWFHYGEMSISGNLLVFSVKEVSKLFEYYCLQRFLQQIKKDGFSLMKQGAELFPYPAPNDRFRMDTEVCNTYRFSRGDVSLTLYYEPILYAEPPRGYKNFPNGLTLYRVQEKLYYKNFWKPDFIIKLESNGIASYAIFDSKFVFNDSLRDSSLLAGHKNTRIPAFDMVVSKYLNRTNALKNSEVKMVFTLQGRSEGTAFMLRDEDNDLLGVRRRMGETLHVGNFPISALPSLDRFADLWKITLSTFNLPEVR